MVACSAVPAAGASSVRQTKSTKVSRDTVLRREIETLDAPATCCSSSHNEPPTQKVSEMFPRHVNPMQWQLAMDYARLDLRAHFSRWRQRQRCAQRFQLGPGHDDARLERLGQPYCRGLVRQPTTTQGGGLRKRNRLGLQFDVPIEVVEPAFVQVCGGNCGRCCSSNTEGRAAAPRLHAGLARRRPPLVRLHARAGGDDVLPGLRPPRERGITWSKVRSSLAPGSTGR